MYIFLSSGARERYRNDVLRCISAPIGTQITFRYRTKHVDESLLEKDSIGVSSSRSVICHVNTENVCHGIIIPIRFATMEKVFLPGSTLILQLKLEGFARYLGDNFDDLIHSVGNGTLKLPTNTGERVEGKFALKTNEDLFLQETYEISAWESTVNEIYERGSIEKEIHFVIVGIFEENPGEIKSLIEWRDYINVNNEYKILVYIFSPSANTIDMSDYCLHLSSSVEVESKNPRDLLVNAPHDLKNWSIRVPPQSLLGTGYEWLGTREGWIQVGPKTVEDENQLDNSSPFVWEVDLTLNHGRGWPAFCVAFLLLGIIFATPVFLATWKPGKMSDTESFIAAGYALLFGAFAASGILYLPLFPSLSEWVRKQL